MRKRTALILGAAAGSAVLYVYIRHIRPWQLHWGAIEEEVKRAMPGDDIVKRPFFNATRAITIHARPGHIWPWLVQIGCLRAGWYSYDWLDNLGHPSAERIIPELQNLKVGDMVPMSPDGKQGVRVEAMEPPGMMLWVSDNRHTSWAWGLYPIDETSTRLVTRIRTRHSWTPFSIFFSTTIMEFGDIVMIRKELLNIKRRAEAVAAGRILMPPEATAWAKTEYLTAY